MQVTRLYYWIKGAPVDRPGGPWWYEDFKGGLHGSPVKQRVSFINAFGDLLYKKVFYDGEYIAHNSMNIHPPH